MNQLKDTLDSSTKDNTQEYHADAHQFLLDSRAHITQIITPSPIMFRLNSPITTSNATNTDTLCTSAGIITLKPVMSKKIRMRSLSNPSFRRNLLSVHDISTYHGFVLLSSNTAYVIYARSMKPQIILTAPWDHQWSAYVVHDILYNSIPQASLYVLDKFVGRKQKLRTTKTQTKPPPNLITRKKHPAAPPNPPATQDKKSRSVGCCTQQKTEHSGRRRNIQMGA